MSLSKGIHPTPAMQAAWRQFDDVRVRGGILLVTGHAGTGKSTLLSTYQGARPAQAWAGPVLLYRTDTVSTPLALVDSLRGALGHRGHGDTRTGLYQVERELPPGALLLVDDAHRLARHSLDALRRLHERTGLRLVLAGTPGLGRVLRAKAGALLHRVHGRITLPALDPPQVAAFVRDAVRRPDEALSDTLHACTDGNLYWLSEGLRLARERARGTHARLSARGVQQVFDGLYRSTA